MAEFISTYQGINYKIPESDKYAKFNQGRFSTSDEQVISYLRQHPDYGSVLTEVENPTRTTGMTVDMYFCPVEGCDRVFKTAQALAAHMRTHKNEVEGAGVDGDA